MTDQPERVWLTRRPGEWISYPPAPNLGEPCYVPEQRALDAERERDVLAKQLNPVNDGNGGNNRGNGGNNLHVYVERFPTAKQLEWDSRVEWFLETGDVKQWSGPNGENPLPQMREDFNGYIAALRAQVAALTAEREAAARHFLQYAWHEYECAAFHLNDQSCNCGFRAACVDATALLLKDER